MRYGLNQLVSIQSAMFGNSYAKREVKIDKELIGYVGRRYHSDEWDFTALYSSYQDCQGLTLNEVANLLEKQEYRRING